jgi:flagellar basal body P-ring formation protein FlgA
VVIALRPVATACVLGLGLPWQGALAGPVSGDMAVGLVRAAMAEAGVPAPAMAAPLRALPDCDHPPRVAPRGGAWAAAELTCDTPSPWVRVLRTGSAGAMTPPRESGATGDTTAPTAAATLVAARPLPKGRRIAPDDLATGTAAGLAPALRLDDPALAVGRRLRVAVGTGQPVTERHLLPALDVEPEQMVTALLATQGIEITTTAQAIAGGTIGDRIPLRNPSGGRETEGIIIAPGIVRVRPNMPRENAVTR